MNHEFPLPISPAAWAQVTLRAFARATNLLVCGQTFRIVVDQLSSTPSAPNTPTTPSTSSAPTIPSTPETSLNTSEPVPAHSGTQYDMASVSDCAHVAELAALLRGFGAQVEFHSLESAASSLDSVSPCESASSYQEASYQKSSGQVSPCESTSHASASLCGPGGHIQATFIVAPSGPIAQDAALRLGGLRVLAPLQGPCVVVDAAGGMMLHPYDPGIGSGATEREVYAAHRVEWTRSRMPMTRAALSRLRADYDLSGVRVGLSLVLEPKTAVLALELRAAGADVVVFSHANETRDDVAAVLRDRGIDVFADSLATPEREEELARAFLTSGVEYLLDDGSHIIRMAHDPERAPGALERLVGAAEETTSGLRPLRAWQEAGHLRLPVVASNDARSKTLFDNAYGTGQSCLLTTLDLMDPADAGVDMAAHHVVVVGYGDVGKGCARFAAALGASVSVVDHDPVRALQALMDGFTVGTLRGLAPTATLLVSATGERNTVPVSVLRTLPAGAVVTVAGGVSQEVATDDATSCGAVFAPVATPGGGVARDIEDLRFPDGHHVRLTDRGGCINCTAGEGNPIEIMDLSFTVQVAALRELIARGRLMPPGVHALPTDADNEAAAAALRLWASPAVAASGLDADGKDDA